MNTSIDYKKTWHHIAHFLLTYQLLVTAAITVAIVAVVALQMNGALESNIDQEHLNTQLGQLQIVEFDEAAIEQIKGLIDSQVEINPRFLDQRSNPFGE